MECGASFIFSSHKDNKCNFLTHIKTFIYIYLTASTETPRWVGVNNTVSL